MGKKGRKRQKKPCLRAKRPGTGLFSEENITFFPSFFFCMGFSVCGEPGFCFLFTRRGGGVY
jgi:hypothetical protein